MVGAQVPEMSWLDPGYSMGFPDSKGKKGCCIPSAWVWTGALDEGKKFKPRALGHVRGPHVREVRGGGPRLFRRETGTLKGAHIIRPRIPGRLGTLVLG